MFPEADRFLADQYAVPETRERAYGIAGSCKLSGLSGQDMQKLVKQIIEGAKKLKIDMIELENFLLPKSSPHIKVAFDDLKAIQSRIPHQIRTSNWIIIKS